MSKIMSFAGNAMKSAKSIVKIIVESRRCTIKRTASADEVLIVMGNGPSLADTMTDFADVLKQHSLMAVNFAANAEEFYSFRPRYYVMADPVFFASEPHENVVKLWNNLCNRVDWTMTIFVPTKMKKSVNVSSNPFLTVEYFNPVGVEGFDWLENMVYSSGRGMPRPRNVLIASLMVALKIGYKQIFVTGADHSWTRTLEVSEQNEVISIQPHFYKDNDAEHSRVASVYKNIRLHEIMYSFYVAFYSYFGVERFARHYGAVIYNATPNSFIDAFERKSLSKLR